MELTDKQKKFIDEYLIDLNATQAAIRAGYSVKNADKIGSELLGKTRISQALEKAQAEQSRRTGITADRVLKELARIAFVNPESIIDFRTGEIRKTASKDDLACVAGIKVKDSSSMTGDSTEREVKMCDKLKALDLLGRHLGMYNDKVNVNVNLPIFFEGEAELEE